MEDPQIRDIPKIKKTLDDLENFRNFKQAMPILRPMFV
jgi:hypothetical protein